MQRNEKFDQFFQSVPPEIDSDAIFCAWKALRPPYVVHTRRPPAPVWARRPYNESGEAAWQSLQQESAVSDLERAVSIYIHIPFCAEKCSFCDCYSFRLRSHRQRHAQQYVDALRREIDLWSALGSLSQRRVTTVHFGGGTPLFLGEDLFRQVNQAVRSAFGVKADTEWAVEATSSDLSTTPNGLLSELGYTRIHIGVQTLDDPLRQILQRREPGADVLDRIDQCVAQGWVVSVDLIFGLPQQNLASFLADIRTLAAHGVAGFSLYPLQVSSRNRSILKAYGPSGKNLVYEFFMICAAEQLLACLGFHKTLFNHYARAKDTNLYFTFPERGEDCLALGTIADGVFNNYHYRHLEYHDYLEQVSATFPALQGGLRRSPAENHLFPLEVALLSGRFSKSRFRELLGPEGADRLFTRWVESSLTREDDHDPVFLQLTASGSWFAGAMINDLTIN